MIKTKNKRGTKWIILILGALTNTIVVAIQSISLSVLLPEISSEMNLRHVQGGVIWGVGSLPIIFSSFFTGILVDRLGPKRTFLIGCLSAGLFGASRGLANNFTTLMITIFAFGLSYPLMTISNVKNTKIWFDENQLGFANGIVSLGMALGFFIGSNVSATIISPWLGGWRNVFFLYGLISLMMMIPWWISPSAPGNSNDKDKPSQKVSWRQISHVIKIRELWLIGLAIMAFSAGIQGLLGYLPLYLRSLGWQEIRADGAASFFHLASMLSVLPITYIAGRLGKVKNITIFAAGLTTLSIGSLFLLQDRGILTAIILAGLSRDSLMAIMITFAVSTKGIGAEYSGIALGFVFFLMGIGNMISPPLGNKLADLSPSVPFLFWGALILVSLICVILSQKKTEHPVKPLDSREE